MNNISLNWKRWICLAMLISCISSVIVTAQVPDGKDAAIAGDVSRNSLQGVWITVVTRRDCATGTVIGSFSGLQTYNFGGTLAETAATPGGPALRGPGHGTWARLQGDAFSSAFIFIRYNPDGTFAGWQRVRTEHLLNDTGDEWTATAAIEILAPNGTVVGSGCATAAGVRFE